MTYKVHPKDHTVTSNGPPKYSERTLNEPPNDPQHDSQFTYKGPPHDLKLVLKLHPPDPTWPSYACVSIIVMHTYAVVALGAISCATMTRHTTLIISCACAACRALVSMLLPHTLFI